MFLLATNSVSALRKAMPHGCVVAWVSAQEANALFVSAMTIAELQRGIEIVREQDTDKAEQFEAWLGQLMFTGQLLAIDAAVSREWARLMHRRPVTQVDDAFIAATARVHRLTVVARNVRDFKTLGVGALNPFEKRQ